MFKARGQPIYGFYIVYARKNINLNTAIPVTVNLTFQFFKSNVKMCVGFCTYARIQKSRSSCFPAHSTVQVLDELSGEFVETTMDNVSVEMLVQDADSGSSSRVTGFVHKSSNGANADYLSFIFSNESRTGLDISPYHRIFLANGNDVFAKDVKVGDMLANGQTIQNIENVVYDSLYAPVTESGMIVVNNVPASCYANVPHFVAHVVTSVPMMIQNYFERIVNGIGLGFGGDMHYAAPIGLQSVY